MVFSVLIVAAGNSTRMGGENKQLLTVGELPVIVRSAEAFRGIPDIKEILVAVKPEEKPVFDEVLSRFLKSGEIPVTVIPSGGETRQKTVEQSLRYLSGEVKYLAIHDGARPLVRKEDVEKTFAACRTVGGSVLGVMAKDTVKIIRKDGLIEFTPDRSTLFTAQTPQAFKLSEYRAALETAKQEHFDFTDDAQLFDRTRRKVAAVIGHYDNIKITTPEDIKIAESLLQQMENRS